MPKRARGDKTEPPQIDSGGALEYRNRKGDVYYLQCVQTRTGKPRYFLGRKLTGTPLARLPEGYEIHEAPSTAIAALRKKLISEILPEERRLAEDLARSEPGIRNLLVDVEKRALVVYVPGMSEESAHDLLGSTLLGGLMTSRLEQAIDRLVVRSTYLPMLRLTFVGGTPRLFTMERWCFRGSIDDWIYLDGPQPLAALLEKYAQHLGQESFYELM